MRGNLLRVAIEAHTEHAFLAQYPVDEFISIHNYIFSVPSLRRSDCSAIFNSSRNVCISPLSTSLRLCTVRPIRWSVTRPCGKLYVLIFAERSPVETSDFLFWE